MNKQRIFQIWRTHEQSGRFIEYMTDIKEGMLVLDGVLKIQEEKANDLAVRYNCKAGKCGSCAAEINGHPALMCMTPMSHLEENKPVKIEPLKSFPNIKDLVTDLSWNYEVKKKIKKFQTSAPSTIEEPWLLKQDDIERIKEFRECIECFLCQDVCHVLREHQLYDKYIGPRFFVYSANIEMHPMNISRGLEDLKESHGIPYCNITKCCTKVCPQEIRITDNAIIPLKERIVDQYFDPVRMLLKKITGRFKKS